MNINVYSDLKRDTVLLGILCWRGRKTLHNQSINLGIP